MTAKGIDEGVSQPTAETLENNNHECMQEKDK